MHFQALLRFTGLLICLLPYAVCRLHLHDRYVLAHIWKGAKKSTKFKTLNKTSSVSVMLSWSQSVHRVLITQESVNRVFRLASGKNSYWLNRLTFPSIELKYTRLLDILVSPQIMKDYRICSPFRGKPHGMKYPRIDFLCWKGESRNFLLEGRKPNFFCFQIRKIACLPFSQLCSSCFLKLWQPFSNPSSFWTNFKDSRNEQEHFMQH